MELTVRGVVWSYSTRTEWSLQSGGWYGPTELGVSGAYSQGDGMVLQN